MKNNEQNFHNNSTNSKKLTPPSDSGKTKNNNNKQFSIDKHNSNFEKNSYLIKKIKKNKSKKHKRIMLAIKIAIIAIIMLLIFFIFSIFSKFNRKLNPSDIGLSKEDEIAEKQLNDITNILLLGIDDNNISDAIMLASIDKINKKINLISIARDSLVKIEPKNKKAYYSKINEAYSNGHEETTLKTINKNFGLRLMDYVTINFDGLSDVIDALGGIDLEISKKESRQIDGIVNSTKVLKRKHPQMLRGKFGPVHLNGSQAVAYARIRHVETLDGLRDDFGRTARQRHIMDLIFKKIMNFNKAKMFSLINALLPHIKTSLDLKTITTIYQCLKGKNYNIQQTQIPAPPYTINPNYTYNSKSTVFYDLKYAGKLINEIIYNNSDQKTFLEDNPPKMNNITSPFSEASSQNSNKKHTLNKKANYAYDDDDYNNNNNYKNKKYTSAPSNSSKKIHRKTF